MGNIPLGGQDLHFCHFGFILYSCGFRTGTSPCTTTHWVKLLLHTKVRAHWFSPVRMSVVGRRLKKWTKHCKNVGKEVTHVLFERVWAAVMWFMYKWLKLYVLWCKSINRREHATLKFHVSSTSLQSEIRLISLIHWFHAEIKESIMFTQLYCYCDLCLYLKICDWSKVLRGKTTSFAETAEGSPRYLWPSEEKNLVTLSYMCVTVRTN